MTVCENKARHKHVTKHCTSEVQFSLTITKQMIMYSLHKQTIITKL